MVWVKIDDGFSEHPKIAKVGAIGAWIQVQALCYSNRNLTDGFLPESIANNFGHNGTEHIGIATGGIMGGSGRPLAEIGQDCNEIDWPMIMVEAGLWEVVDGGYLIHDFLKFNPSKEQILNARQKDNIRKESKRNPAGSQSESKRPVPVPGPLNTTPPAPPQGGHGFRRGERRMTKREIESEIQLRIGKGPND